MELTSKQEKQLSQTRWFHATLLKHLESLNQKIDVSYNLGNELDFGAGFYITPDFEQARKFINKQVEMLNKSTVDEDEIFESKADVGIILEFCISDLVKIFKNSKYRCHYFSKHKQIEEGLDFAEFVFQNRNEPNRLHHDFDFIYGVQTDDNPTQVMRQYQHHEISKEEMLEEFRKPYSFKQLSIHNQEYCDIMKIEKVYDAITGEELEKW